MPDPDFSVADKQVLITGGAGGIGRAFATGFHAHGAQVLITDLQPPPEARCRQASASSGWTCATMPPSTPWRHAPPRSTC